MFAARREKNMNVMFELGDCVCAQCAQGVMSPWHRGSRFDGNAGKTV